MNNYDELKKNVAEALSILVSSGMINQTQCNVLEGYYAGKLNQQDLNQEEVFRELGNLFRKPGFVEQKLDEILNSKIISGDTNVSTSPIPEPVSPVPVSPISDDIEILDMGFDEQAQYNGVTPTDMNSNEYEGEGQSKGKQKRIGSHPGTGGLRWGEDNGFMAFLFVMFLAGISSGIIFMIVLNFLAK